MGTHPTPTGRTQLLYLIPAVAFMLGFVLLALSDAVPHNLSNAFWAGGLFLLVVVGIGGLILAGVIALGLYLWRGRAAKTPQ